jgi:hypothetical protein
MRPDIPHEIISGFSPTQVLLTVFALVLANMLPGGIQGNPTPDLDHQGGCA